MNSFLFSFRKIRNRQDFSLGSSSDEEEKKQTLLKVKDLPKNISPHTSQLTTYNLRNGFTLLEILIVLSIVVSILGIFSFRYWKGEQISLNKEKNRLSLVIKYYFYKAYAEKRDFDVEVSSDVFSIREGEKVVYRRKFPSYIQAEAGESTTDTFLISHKGYVTPFAFILRNKEGNTLPLTITPLGRVEGSEGEEFRP
ncbi:MAG: type II secretion system protein [Caldiserica bacterium]|nr:type II secretion system protein [Caldisericota bacterium]